MNNSAIAAIIRELSDPNFSHDAPGNYLELAGRLLIKAIDEGAWSGPEHVAFVARVKQRAQQAAPTNGFISAWSEAVWFLSGRPTAPQDLEGSFSEDCKLVIEAMLTAVPVVSDQAGKPVDHPKEVYVAERLEAERARERTDQLLSRSGPDARRTGFRGYDRDASALVLPALLTHHQYDSGEGRDSIGNYNPISVSGLKRYHITKAVASRWFKKHFGSHRHYKIACVKDSGRRLFEVLRKLCEEDPTYNTGANLDEIAAPADDEVADREVVDAEAVDDEE